MPLFLLKPHVIGAGDDITTPDVIIDRMFIDGSSVPVNFLTHEIWQQVVRGTTARAAYGLMALGGGALILPVLVLDSGTVIPSRMSWRLNNLDGHICKVTLNGLSLEEIGLPRIEIETNGGNGDALPRGYFLVRTRRGKFEEAELADPKSGRVLNHRVVFEFTDHDRWGDDRPRPRYSIGPTGKELRHYI